MSKCCFAFIFPPKVKRKHLEYFLEALLKIFFFRWAGPNGFRLISRMIRVKKKKEVWLNLAVEMEGFSEDCIKECWTDVTGLKEGQGYKFLELNDDEELQLKDWGQKIIRSTPVVEYGGMGPFHGKDPVPAMPFGVGGEGPCVSSKNAIPRR